VRAQDPVRRQGRRGRSRRRARARREGREARRPHRPRTRARRAGPPAARVRSVARRGAAGEPVMTAPATGRPRSSRGVRLLAIATAAMASALALLAPSPARADGRFIDLRAALLAGPMTGWGSGSPDFYHQAQGPGLGAEVGLRLLVMDVS